MRNTTLYRIARRLMRRMTRPLRLLRNAHQLAVAEQNIAYYEGVRVDASAKKQLETDRLSQLACKRMAIERGLA